MRAFIVLFVVIISLLGPSAQAPQPIAPGGSLTVSCSTDLSVRSTSGQSMTISCDAAPGTTATALPATVVTTAAPGATATIAPPTVTTAPPVATGPGLWISPAELTALPMSGPAWMQVNAAANASLGVANIADQESDHDVNTLAVALVAMRTNNPALRAKAANAIMDAIDTEIGGRTLALARNLPSYVIAADVINLHGYNAQMDTEFRSWLSGVRTEPLDGMTLVGTQERRPNNWGTHASAALIAADLYLGDAARLSRAVEVFHGYLGLRSAYAVFSYGDLSWQSDSAHPVGINPVGATKDGHSIDGVIPDDQRRTGGFSWPPPCGNYTHGSLQGSLVAAQLLYRAGYDAWQWENQALRRAYAWLYSTADGKSACPATSDDTWAPALVNRAYGTTYPFGLGIGKNMAWAAWVFAR